MHINVLIVDVPQIINHVFFKSKPRVTARDMLVIVGLLSVKMNLKRPYSFSTDMSTRSLFNQPAQPTQSLSYFHFDDMTNS